MSYIYKIVNKINGKIYIGQTSLTPELRFNKHKRCYKSDSCPKLYNAMRKYGKNNFYVETICETLKPNDDEKYWIEYYNSIEKGYNVSTGGDAFTTLPKKYEDEVINLYLDNKTIHDISRITNRSREYIREVLERNNLRKYNKKEIDKDLIINEYKLLKQVNLVSKKVKVSVSTIRKILRENNIEIYNHKNDRYIIFAYDKKTGNKIKEFTNREEIINFIKKSNKKTVLDHIFNCVKGGRKSAYGYIWKKIIK